MASGPYLTVQAGCLSAGGTYAFRLVVSSSEGRTGSQQVRQQLVWRVWDQDPGDVHGSSFSLLCCLIQVLVYANQPPSNGTCTTRPNTGVALTTVFESGCRSFQDPDGHLPLTYLFSALRAGQQVLLASPTNMSGIMVGLYAPYLIPNPLCRPPPSLTMGSLLAYVIWPARRTSPVVST